MMWPFVVLLVLIGLIKVVLTCLPTSAVEWIISKFELHPTLSDATTTITIDEKHLEGEEKNQVIRHFNEALVLEKYYVHPENSGTPLVIDTKRGKDIIKLFVYSYSDHVDVVKKDKKKVVAYRLRSDSLQQLLCG